jgi:hypothetical protein
MVELKVCDLYPFGSSIAEDTICEYSLGASKLALFLGSD